MRTVGIYHKVDLDGYCSGAIIKKKYPYAELIGWSYGDPIPELSECKVVMADISFPPDIMDTFSRENEVLWIDHHKSAIEAFEEYYGNGGEGEDKDIPFDFVLDKSFAACELTWKTLFKGGQMPIAVKLLGTYDAWRDADKNYWDSYVMPFQFGMRMQCTSPETFNFLYLDPTTIDFIKAIISVGETILKYQGVQDEQLSKKAAFEHEIMGLKAICINGANQNSSSFDSVYDPTKHDVMVPFRFDGTGWNFSMYSTKEDVDCSYYAKAFGGGGHAGAAGFRVEDLTEIFGDKIKWK